ncbi:hypothetical protein RDWZM_002966 [Blomia tropicalis]|uniref:Tropomodulin n=1 Tax=Blomia tropicalis TaxID=40697 RepID=A0A9Q0RS41_BLOTA|nr:hypothetical protein RDWZM_002966 [Blomia tropicalis]
MASRKLRTPEPPGPSSSTNVNSPPPMPPPPSLSQITKTTRTVNQRRLSERKNSQEFLQQQPKLKMLYGRDLKDYENLNVEDLLNQLSAEELEQLSEEVDPDDSLLPPSQRCKEQTFKDPTGPLNRRQLLNFLTKFAKEQEDWPENKKFVPGVKLGKTWVPKPSDNNLNDEKIILDMEDGAENALNNASEADLVDLAGILGLHSMLSQDQYHASILNKGQLSNDKFESIVKSTKPRKAPAPEPDNMTDPEKTAKQIIENDPGLTELNWNNIKYIPRETFKKLFNGLKTNSNLTELHLSNTGLTDGPAEKLVEALRHNESVRKINLESNYLSGPMLRDLIEALLEKQYVVEFRAANQRPTIMGNRIEMEIASLVQQNKSLLKLGLNFDVPDARHKVAAQLQQNNDNCRLKRLASVEG